jgi:hypothetical protein
MEVVRRAIQDSKESVKTLSEKYSINHKTVLKWRKRNYAHDSPWVSKILDPQFLAEKIAFRKHTLLPLDDRLYAL